MCSFVNISQVIGRDSCMVYFTSQEIGWEDCFRNDLPKVSSGTLNPVLCVCECNC